MQHQATRTQAVPRPPAAESPHRRPLPRPPGSRHHEAAESSLTTNRPPGNPRQRHDEMESPREPRPPAESPPGDPRPPSSSPERPLRPPPGHDHYHQLPTTTRHSDLDPDPSWAAPPPRTGSALASCLAATAFLLLAAGGAGAALFLLFRPRPPDIEVAAVRLPAFAAANGTVAFTFEQTAVVRNPNRSPLAHFDSSLHVAYAGVGELGHAYIPAGLIDGGRANRMSASFQVPAFFILPPQQQQQQVMAAAAMADPPPPPEIMIMEVESLLVVKGRVTMLRVLTHRVQAAKLCRVAVSPIDGRVLGFRC